MAGKTLAGSRRGGRDERAGGRASGRAGRCRRRRRRRGRGGRGRTRSPTCGSRRSFRSWWPIPTDDCSSSSRSRSGRCSPSGIGEDSDRSRAGTRGSCPGPGPNHRPRVDPVEERPRLRRTALPPRAVATPSFPRPARVNGRWPFASLPALRMTRAATVLRRPRDRALRLVGMRRLHLLPAGDAGVAAADEQAGVGGLAWRYARSPSAPC